MLYPGSVYLLQKALMPVLLQGQARLVEEVRPPYPSTTHPTAFLPPPMNVASCPSNLANASSLLSVMGAGQSCWPAMAMKLTPCLWTDEGQLSPRDRSW